LRVMNFLGKRIRRNSWARKSSKLNKPPKRGFLSKTLFLHL